MDAFASIVILENVMYGVEQIIDLSLEGKPKAGRKIMETLIGSNARSMAMDLILSEMKC